MYTEIAKRKSSSEGEEEKLDKKVLKEYLGQVYRKRNYIRTLESRLSELNFELRHPISSVQYSATPRSKTNRISDKTASLAMKREEIQERIIEQKEGLARSILLIMDLMNILPEYSLEREIVELRHIDCKDWYDICEIVSLTRTPCNAHYNAGMEQILSSKRGKEILRGYQEKKDK